MENTTNDIHKLVQKMLDGEIVLPDIQRDYVWQGTQIPRFLDSLNHEWPVGSILLWDTRLEVPTKAAAVMQGTAPVARPTILLDGQQRLTSLARVFASDRVPAGEKPPDVRYNLISKEFRNANAIQRRDASWIRASDFLKDGAQFREVVRAAKIAKDTAEEDKYTDDLTGVAKRIRDYRLAVQVINENDYEKVAEIFNRVNTGGRRLSKGDLVMGTLAARWKEGRRRIENFESELAGSGWRFNREVLLRVMSVIAVNSPNHVRLVDLKDAGKWEQHWTATENAFRHSIAFFVHDARIPNLGFLPSEYLAVIPSVVMHRQNGVLQPGESNALCRWLYLAGAFAHYSGSTETTLSSDLNLLDIPYDEGDPLKALLQAAQAPRTLGSRITADDLRGKGLRSPFLRLLQIRAVQTGADSWWSHRALGYGAVPKSLKVEVHHIFPKAWLRTQGIGNHPERDTIANFAFLSKYDNIQISDSDPALYLASAQLNELAAQWVPQEHELWTAGRFTEFCGRRRELLAEALNAMLNLTGSVDTDTLGIPDESDEPEIGAWAEDFSEDPDSA